MERFFDLDRNETEELVTNYGPLGVMWFDGDWEEPWTGKLGSQLYVELKELHLRSYQQPRGKKSSRRGGSGR